MHTKLALGVFVTALTTFATASPVDLVPRQDGGPAAGAPGAPPAPGPGNCFIGRAIRGNYDVVGEFLEAHLAGCVRLDQNPKQADIFVLDNNGQLRLARNPASVASRNEFLHQGVGSLIMSQRQDKKSDPVTCSIDGGILNCWTKKGDQVFSHQDQVWVGSLSQLVPRHQDITPLTIAVYGVPCPAGPRPWETWG